MSCACSNAEIVQSQIKSGTKLGSPWELHGISSSFRKSHYMTRSFSRGHESKRLRITNLDLTFLNDITGVVNCN